MAPPKPEINSARQKVRERILRWSVDPVAFVREVMDAEPQPWQAQAMMALVSEPRVAVKSGHGVGKSTMLAWVILWWMCTRRPCKVAATANTAHQLSDVLWSEIGRWHKAMKVLKNEIEIKSDKIQLKGAPDSFTTAKVARRDQPEALAGLHSDRMLYVVDECSGIPDVIFEVAQGALSSPGAKIIMTGNPTRTSGYFYDAFNVNADRWYHMTVSCLDSERVSQDFIDDMARQYGEESGVYKIRVLGEFDEGEGDHVVSRALADAAVKRQVEPTETGPTVWGLDVSRTGGDRTALCKRRGNAVLEVISWRGLDLMETCGRVKAEFDNARWDVVPEEICVDSIGLGAGVADRLNELGLPTRAVNVAESSAMGDRFMRLRDELWWSAREWLEQRDCVLPDDEQLVNELCLPTFAYTSNGKIKIESKDESKKRYGGKSPDLADALVLTFASTPMMVAGSTSQRWSQPILYNTNIGIV